MRVSGSNRLALMHDIQRNEDLLNLPTNRSSRKKPFLYATLAAAGLGAAFLAAYKSGVFSPTIVPTPTPPPSSTNTPTNLSQ